MAFDDATLSELIYPTSSDPAASAADCSDTDPRRAVFERVRDHFLKELKRTGVTKQLLWEEYRNLHPDSYGK